jgi:EAL domain-containing protein (putative c-di-GMP-specific phosphodiesterase class I)
MYAAKARGGSSVDVYRPSLHLAAVAELELERALRGALEREDIRVAYQPIVDATSGRVVALEALARWTENGIPIEPNNFIPLAEATGLIVRLGTYVLNRACREARRLQDAGFEGIAMCVNISARQFREFDFAGRVRSALEAAQIPAHSLELEITESAYISADSGIRNIEALEELGVRLSIDDFGTGYSSLGYLKRLPVDAVKIDRSFVADILNDSADQAIVRAIIAVAANLGLVTIAEGVETAEQADFLRLLGCAQLQGFFFARPLPPEALDEFLRQPSLRQPGF